MAPGRRSVIGIYTQLVEHGGVRKLLPKCWVGARAVDHLREQAPGLARDSGVGPPACHERLLPDDGAQGRRGHDEKEILAVHVNDMGKIRGAEHRPERLDGLCLAEDARAIALPIVLDAQLLDTERVPEARNETPPPSSATEIGSPGASKPRRTRYAGTFSGVAKNSSALTARIGNRAGLC